MGSPESRRECDPPLWHTLPSETVFAHLKSTPTGLTGAEATQRLAEHGPNELQAAHRISPWTILLEKFKNLLIPFGVHTQRLAALQVRQGFAGAQW